MKKTFAEWVLALTRGYTKVTGKKPDKLSQLKINMEAGQKVRDQEKVIKVDFGKKKPWHEKKAGGGRAGYDNGKLVQGESYIPPKNFYGVGLGPVLNEFMSEGRPIDEEGYHTTLNKKDLINLWNYLKENQDVDLEDELMFRFGRVNPDENSMFHLGLGKDKAEIGFKKKFNKGGRVPLKHGSISDVLPADFDELDPEELTYIIKLLKAGEIPQYASGGRVPFKVGGKGKVLEGLAKLFDKFFPGTTKIGQRSKPYPEKVQEKMDLRKAIADFHERQKNKKLRRIGDNNPPSPIEEEAVTNKKIRETIKADEKTLAKLQKEHNKKYGPGSKNWESNKPMSDSLYKQHVEEGKKISAIENRILENRIKINDPPTKDDYQYYSEQLDIPDADYHPVKGNETLAELEAMVKKADADYEAEKKYWQKVFQKDDKKQMEKYGVLVNRLTEKNKLYKEFPNITDHQVADILRTDLDGTINPRKIEAAKETLRKQTGSPWYTDPKTLTPEEELRREFPGISDDLIKNILADDNPQRIAEVKATLKEALKMQEKGMGPDEIINIFKKKPTKHASGGLAGMLGE